MDCENKRILIIKPSSLGDIVHTLPLVHALKRKYPDSTIGWIVQEAFAPLLERDPAVDMVYPVHIPSTSDPQAGRFAYFHAFTATVKMFKKLHGQLKHAPFDLILDLHASFRSGLLGRTNPGGLRLGFKGARELNSWFQDQLVTVPESVQHALDKNLLFCRHLACSVLPEDFHMCCSTDDIDTVQIFLRQEKVADGAAVIYANPAARWQTKFWPARRWAELADRLRGRGTPLVFGGSGQDVPYITSITRLMKTPGLVAAGRFNLPQTVALIQHSSLYVGLDSGPMHMAALSGVPAVALFGPTHPSRVGPYGVAHAVVRAADLDCLECRKRTCVHLRCMRGISVSMVYDAAISLLENTDSGTESDEKKSV
ncbi:MAG TPA: glycosyltransferase family 9 protein [Desulfobulbus sp.]|nr:glycosyltransferase family 9 protein [Desulfobulbus sp.]